MHVNYAIVFVSDMHRSVSFYRDTIGLPLRFESPHWTEFCDRRCDAGASPRRIEPANGRRRRTARWSLAARVIFHDGRLANVWRFAQIGFRWRTGHPGDIPGGIDRDEHQGIV